MTLLRGKQIVLPKSQIQQGVRDYKRNQLRAETAQQTSIPQVANTTQDITPNANNLTSGAISSEVAQPIEDVQSNSKVENNRYTISSANAENVQYEEMSAEDAWDRLVAESGDDVDIATMVAQSNIEDAQKALDKAKKQTPKLVGTTEEKLATAKAFKESVVKAQNDLAAWQEIADVPKRRASLQTEQTEPQDQQVADKLPASEEVDENGYPFITSSNVTTIFGEITEDTGLPNAPIKLSEGIIDDNGYGLAHIDVRHGEQIRNAGFNSVVEFVEYVANNYDKDNIKVGKKRPNGSGTFIIQIEDKHSNLLYIELSRDGSYWNVNSGGIFRKGYAEKKKNVGLNTELSTSPTTEEDKSFVQTEDKGSVSADTQRQPTSIY